MDLPPSESSDSEETEEETEKEDTKHVKEEDTQVKVPELAEALGDPP